MSLSYKAFCIARTKFPFLRLEKKDARWVSLLLHKEKHVISHYYSVIQALKLSLVWLTNQIICLIFKRFILRHCLLVISGMTVWYKSLHAMLKCNVSKSIFNFTGRYFQFSYHSRRVGPSDCVVYVKCLIYQCKKYVLIHQYILFCPHTRCYSQIYLNKYWFTFLINASKY